MKAPEIIEISGEIDLHRAEELRQALAPAMERRAPEILLDLSEVSYMDSSGLAVLIESYQKARQWGGAFALCGVQKRVRAILDIACLDQILTLYPDRTAALAG